MLDKEDEASVDCEYGLRADYNRKGDDDTFDQVLVLTTSLPTLLSLSLKVTEYLVIEEGDKQDAKL